MKPDLAHPSLALLAQQQAAAAALAPARALALPEATATGLADFNDRAGINPHAQPRHHRVPLARRLQPARQAEARKSRSNNPDGSRLEHATQQLLDTLQHGDQAAAEEQLPHDPLERYTLLRSALEQVGADDTPERQAQTRRLDGMLARLEREHGPRLRQGRADGAAFEHALQELERHGGADAAAPLDARARFGARDGEAVSPAALFDALLAQAGPDHCLTALGRARAQQRSELATRKPGPRLWLSLGDASAFNVVQGCAAQAGQLREAISARVGMLPPGHHADTTALLLNIGARREQPADHLLRELSGTAGLDPERQARLCVVLREQVRRLPDALWPDGAAGRAALVQELSGRTAGLHDTLESAPDAASHLEQRLRRHWHQSAPHSPPLSAMEK